ncbi:fused MFS/spermidine synthase [Myxococcota bacterium]|nr:fused MFS/spermidine synthase [Myxococcota bacterium]
MQSPTGDSRVHSMIGERSATDRSTRGAALFVTAVLCAAFLVFLVQPMVGKRILPWFGGVPAVWTVCLAFYQTTLFAGYAYAHCLIRFVGPNAQLAVHAVAVALAFLALPVLPDAPAEIDGELDPTRTVIGLLAKSVALPFLVLASTGPLVQVWLARAHPSVSPYWLYSVSNAGSFLALFAYPFAIEPRLSVSTAGEVFTLGFVVTGLLVLACAVLSARAAPVETAPGTTPAAEPGEERTPSSSAMPAETLEREPSAARRRLEALRWIALSAGAVVVLMGVTNKLCLDVASIPFLWIVPLATYLLTFIVAFGSERTYRRAPYGTLAVVSFLVSRAIELDDLIVFQAAAYCALLFSTCMVLHGELYRSRPSPRYLTRFYLCVSAGGALGGLFVGLAAPLLFDDYHELSLGLLFALVMMLAICTEDPGSFFFARPPRWRWALAAPIVCAFVGYFLWLDLRPEPLRLSEERSFFGVLAVDEVHDGVSVRRTLSNGSTVHGAQIQDPRARQLPTAYYGRATGLGLLLTSRPRERPSRIGVVGLGIGTIAAYGRAGDEIRFYEIDPVVARLAGAEGPFSYLADSKARVEVVVGDGRRALESEQGHGRAQGFDLLVLDAFTSDAIPVHLMTREAFDCYFRALAPDGLLAVHVSNRHFRLMDLVSRMAAARGGHSLQIKTATLPELESGGADWVVVARDAEELARLRIRIEKRLRRLKLLPGSVLIRRGADLELDDIPVWTDDYSDLSRVVRWN